MPTIKLDTYEVVITFAGECNAGLTINGLTRDEADRLFTHIGSDWNEDVTVPLVYTAGTSRMMLNPSTIHAMQVLEELEYVTHPPDELREPAEKARP